MIKTITIDVPHKGLHEITHRVREAVHESAATEGVCTVFIQHTSASLIVQENADPSARRDLENWLDRHVPEDDPRYTHTLEGPDDMPSHIRAAITATSLSIPIIAADLALGTWQGIFLWEHRTSPKRRRLVIHIGP